ncbi:MAG: hypothetical protein ACI8S6_002183 [Myxococcota bacterium]|jgi:hypothetical protein
MDDTGLLPRHPVLRGAIITSRSFTGEGGDIHGHGTGTGTRRCSSQGCWRGSWVSVWLVEQIRDRIRI